MTSGPYHVFLCLLVLYQQYKVYHEREGAIEKSVPRITYWHHMACHVVTNGDPKAHFFFLSLTQIMDSSSCSPLKSTFLYLNNWPPEIPVNAEIRHITIMSLNNITMSSLVFLPTDWNYESIIGVQWGQENPNQRPVVPVG